MTRSIPSAPLRTTQRIAARAAWMAIALLLGGLSAPASAQELSATERAQALSRVRTIASCVERQNADFQRLVRLIAESEQQRDQARDARVRQDAERAIEALIDRANTLQQSARSCFAGEGLPTTAATHVIERPAPPDAAADSVAGGGGTVREVERDTALTSNIRVERGEQVDGSGQMQASTVRSAIRSIGPRLERCYERYLERGSSSPRQLDLVFTFRDRGRARAITVERSSFSNPTFERCVRSAGGHLRAGSAPAGGPSTFSYTLRFGGSSR